MLAILHSALELASLVRRHIAEFSLHRLLAVLPFEELFPLLRRHVFPAFLQLPFFIRRQVVEPFAGAAQLLAFFRRQFAEAIEFFADLLALFRRHPFPGLHSLFHVAALLRCELTPTLRAFFQPRLFVRR